MTTSDADLLRNRLEEYYRAVAGDAAATPLPELFTPDATWHLPRSNPLYQEPQRGLDKVMGVLTSGVGIYEQGSLDIRRSCTFVDAAQQRACVQLTLVARLADGTPYENDYVMVFAFRDGLICEVWEHLDTLHQHRLGTFET
ncbi:MAG: nuclear transport factor 2 family protein [Pseudomonadota bacterium]